jgi:hypothetical protein
MGIASRIKDVSGKSISVIDNANFFNKAILLSLNDDDDHIIEEVLNCLDTL